MIASTQVQRRLNRTPKMDTKLLHFFMTNCDWSGEWFIRNSVFGVIKDLLSMHLKWTWNSQILANLLKRFELALNEYCDKFLLIKITVESTFD